jgi:MoxR-like ATPase
MEDEIFEQRTDLGKLNTAVEKIKATLAQIIVGQQ